MKFIIFASLVTSIVATTCPFGKYECCTECNAVYEDKEGKWGVEENKWCKIVEEKCMCNHCDVLEVDKIGKWGVQNNKWCIIDEKKCETSDKPSSDPQYAVNSTLPVLEITTSSGSSDAIDLPTNPYVSDLMSKIIPGYVIPPEPYYEDCSITITDGDGKTVINEAKAKVKVRGNFTTNYPKKPLRIKFDENQSVLGMNNDGKYKNWVLLASYKDISMIRDTVTLGIAREMFKSEGFYASDTRFVEVTVNGDYRGIYILAEQQQIAKGRINGDEVSKDYQGTDISYLLEHDGYANLEDPLNQIYLGLHQQAPLKGFGSSEELVPTGGMETPYMTIINDINSEEQRDFIQNFINGVYDIMYEAAYNDNAYVFNNDYSEITETSEITSQEAVENVVDVDSLANMYIISEIACDADVAFSSFYMDVDFSKNGLKKLRFEAPWDFDSGLGLKGRCPNGQGLYAASIVPSADNSDNKEINPWLSVLIHQEWFQDIIREKWNDYYQNGVFTKAINDVLNNVRSHQSEFDRSYERWDNEEHTLSISFEAIPEIMELKSQSEQADFVEDWLEKRIDFINDQWQN